MTDDKPIMTDELNKIFDLNNIIKKDNILIILTDTEEGEFQVKILDTTDNNKSSTVFYLAHGFLSMLFKDPDFFYEEGMKIIAKETEDKLKEENVAKGNNIIAFNSKKKGL
jgi:hypothetical protein